MDERLKFIARLLDDEKSTLPSWKIVKATLQSFDRAGLLGLVQDLYAMDKNNKAFLRGFSLSQDKSSAR